MPRAEATCIISSRKAHICFVCGFNFGRKWELDRHAKTHANNVEDLKIKCPFEGCRYKSLQKSNVRTHFNSVHLGLREFKCTLDGCDAEYRDGASLIRHEKKKHNYYRKAYNGKKRASKEEKVVKSEFEDVNLSPWSECATYSEFKSDASTPAPSEFTSGPPTPSPSFVGEFTHFSNLDSSFAGEHPQNVNSPQVAAPSPLSFDDALSLGTSSILFPSVEDSLTKHNWNPATDTESFVNIRYGPQNIATNSGFSSNVPISSLAGQESPLVPFIPMIYPQTTWTTTLQMASSPLPDFYSPDFPFTENSLSDNTYNLQIYGISQNISGFDF